MPASHGRCRLIADDRFLPHAFSARGRRLVHSVGIMMLAGLSGLLLIAFNGITDRLIPSFAVGAFGAFTLSQAGMVMHWRRVGGPGSAPVAAVNAIGAVATGIALTVILTTKFIEGAWITIVIVPAMLALFARVKQHYDFVSEQIRFARPVEVNPSEPPVVVVPVAGVERPERECPAVRVAAVARRRGRLCQPGRRR
ncbi:MAG: hypothetical protein DME09_04405 [Candidatus Rokuibacteriota bacterium]|nr:MAG: hypothetical protein DME09_04405 [Candidatus Rokubacteria bacterium]